MDNSLKINCRVCKYLYITWDRNFPNGCRGYGFKSKEIPSVFVLKSSGDNCKVFTPKQKQKAFAKFIGKSFCYFHILIMLTKANKVYNVINGLAIVLKWGYRNEV